MKKNKGSNLVEYIIPTALIGTIVGISLYNIFTNNSLLNYIMATCNMELNGSTLVSKGGSGIVNSTALSGSTSSSELTRTTIGNATTECKDNNCTIDFGTLKLSGVPQNLNSLIETAGTAGATDSILALLQQVADQKETTDPAEAQKIEALIARGKEIMQVEKSFDTWYEQNEKLLLNYSDSIKEYKEAVETINEKYSNSMTCNTSSLASSFTVYYDDNMGNSENCTFKSKQIETAYKNEMDTAYNSTILTPNKELLETLDKVENISINGQTIPYYGAAWDAMYLLNPTAILHVCKDGDIDFTGNKLSFNTTTSQFDDMLSGKLDYEYYKDSTSLPSDVSKNGTFITSPMSYYITELKNVLQNSKDPAVKNITTQLSQEIFNIASRVSEKADKIDSYIWNYTNRDAYDYKIPTNDAVVTTNLDLSIICASNNGQYDNTNKECK